MYIANKGAGRYPVALKATLSSILLGGLGCAESEFQCACCAQFKLAANHVRSHSCPGVDYSPEYGLPKE